MDFFTLFSLGLYGNSVNKYSEPIDSKNEIDSIPRYYDNIYSCNQINNNKTKVFLNASNNYVNSLKPNTNIINKIWRLQNKDRYNQVHIKNDVYKISQDIINNSSKSENEQIRENFITDDIQSFFDKFKTYSSIFLICLIIVSCLCCCC
jgi:hypothetical protein